MNLSTPDPTDVFEHPISVPHPDAEPVSPGEAAFDRWRKLAGIPLTPLAFFGTYLLVGDAVSPEGQRLSAILAAVAVLWVCESLPLPVTALLGAALCVILGVAPTKTVLAHFADPVVFVFIGGFMIARAMTVHALDRRIALSFMAMRVVGSHPARMLAGLGLVTAFLSMWISNTATTAMMLPIALGILGALHQVRVERGLASGPLDARTWPFATGTMLMVAYAASLGGIGTPVGSPPNLIGIAQIRETVGIEISFFQWMAVTVPMMLLMGAALFSLLYLLHPLRGEVTRAGFGGATGGGGDAAGNVLGYVRAERAKLGGWTPGQACTLTAFLFAVTFWVLPGVFQVLAQLNEGSPLGERMLSIYAWFNAHLPEAVVAIAAAVLLFILPTDLRGGHVTLTWAEAVKIDWGTILLFGGGIALGGLMFSTGVAEAMGRGLTGALGVESIWMLTGLAILIAIVMSEAASNTASATMIIPVVIAIAQGAGVNPLPPALGACLGASYGFMLPVSTPPNAIVYGSGLIPLPRMVRAGLLFDVIGFLVIWGGLRVLCPLVGWA